MHRFALTLLAVLALCLSSYLAAAQSTAMAVAHHDCAQMTGKDAGPQAMASHRHQPAAQSRDQSGPEKTCANLCAWACAAHSLAQLAPEDLTLWPVSRPLHPIFAPLLPKETRPPLLDRPPIRALL